MEAAAPNADLTSFAMPKILAQKMPPAQKRAMHRYAKTQSNLDLVKLILGAAHPLANPVFDITDAVIKEMRRRAEAVAVPEAYAAFVQDVEASNDPFIKAFENPPKAGPKLRALMHLSDEI